MPVILARYISAIAISSMISREFTVRYKTKLVIWSKISDFVVRMMRIIIIYLFHTHKGIHWKKKYIDILVKCNNIYVRYIYQEKYNAVK